MGRRLDDDELIEHWTLVGQELEQVAGKRGPSRLGFALLLQFHTLHGRFPRGRHELPDEAIAYVATLVKVPAADLGFYEWQGRTWEYHAPRSARSARPQPRPRQLNVSLQSADAVLGEDLASCAEPILSMGSAATPPEQNDYLPKHRKNRPPGPLKSLVTRWRNKTAKPDRD